MTIRSPRARLPRAIRAVRRWPRAGALLLLRVYKRGISPLLPGACRFHPTCSDYCREAIERHGVVKGLWLGVRRLGRCHPFAKGGFDPVP